MRTLGIHVMQAVLDVAASLVKGMHTDFRATCNYISHALV